MTMSDTMNSTRVEARITSLRERKKHQAQAAIEEAALRLFQQQGYEQTSIQDIADAVMMSPRTFFRYFASKEEALFASVRAPLIDGLQTLEEVAPGTSPHEALRTLFSYVASRYQQQHASFLIRFHVAMQTPSIASLYLYGLVETEPAICDALCSRLESATNRNQMRFLVAIYMAAFRVSIEEWLEHEASDDLVPLLHDHMDCISSLPPS